MPRQLDAHHVACPGETLEQRRVELERAGRSRELAQFRDVSAVLADEQMRVKQGGIEPPQARSASRMRLADGRISLHRREQHPASRAISRTRPRPRPLNRIPHLPDDRRADVRTPSVPRVWKHRPGERRADEADARELLGCEQAEHRDRDQGAGGDALAERRAPSEVRIDVQRVAVAARAREAPRGRRGESEAALDRPGSGSATVAHQTLQRADARSLPSSASSGSRMVVKWVAAGGATVDLGEGVPTLDNGVWPVVVVEDDPQPSTSSNASPKARSNAPSALMAPPLSRVRGVLPAVPAGLGHLSLAGAGCTASILAAGGPDARASRPSHRRAFRPYRSAHRPLPSRPAAYGRPSDVHPRRTL